MWTARRAGWATVDAGRAHREKDSSVKARVSFEHRSPECFIVFDLRACMSGSFSGYCHGLTHLCYLHEHTRAEHEFESIRNLRANCGIFEIRMFVVPPSDGCW